MTPGRIAGITVLGALLCACDQPLPSPKQKAEPAKVENIKQPMSAQYRAAFSHYHTQGIRQLEKALACAGNLRRSVSALLEHPEPAQLADTRDIATHCRRLYLPAEALTASYPALEARLTSLRRRIDSRPISPDVVDGVQLAPQAGIINDPAFPLSPETLMAEQGLSGASDVVLGFEVILFLLEGEHRQNPGLPLRDAADFAPATEWPAEAGETALPISQHPTQRRREYLDIATLLLERDLGLLLKAWRTFAMPVTQEEAQALAFAAVRSWHSVAVSLPAEDVGDVTERLVTLLAGTPPDTPGLGPLMKLDQLDGWPQPGAPLDPMRLVQTLGQWLVQHNR